MSAKHETLITSASDSAGNGVEEAKEPSNTFCSSGGCSETSHHDCSSSIRPGPSALTSA